LARATVLVLGGYGFIGRHIVNELESLNIPVLIGTRRQTSMLSPQNERHIMLHKLTRINSWEKQLDGVDVVINAIGILRQQKAKQTGTWFVRLWSMVRMALAHGGLGE